MQFAEGKKGSLFKKLPSRPMNFISLNAVAVRERFFKECTDKGLVNFRRNVLLVFSELFTHSYPIFDGTKMN